MTRPMEPGQEPLKVRGSETVRTLGDAWVLCYGEGEWPDGGIGKTVMTLGYDPAKQRFVGSFIGSMMANLWVYDGQLDASRQGTAPRLGRSQLSPAKGWRSIRTGSSSSATTIAR